MLYIVNEKTIGGRTFLLSDNIWHSLQEVKQLAQSGQLYNAKLVNNKLIWGLLSHDTEENRFYKSILDLVVNNGSLNIIHEIYNTYYNLIASTTLEQNFKSNLESILKMFMSYLVDTKYTFMKIQFKNSLQSKESIMILSTLLPQYQGFLNYLSNIRLTFLGESLYQIFLLDLSSMLVRHKDESFGDLRINDTVRRLKLDNYLTHYMRNYKKFQQSVLDNKRYLINYTNTYGVELKQRLDNLSFTNTGTYMNKVASNIICYDNLYKLFNSAVEKYTERSLRFITVTGSLFNSANNIVDSKVVSLSNESFKFFNNACKQYMLQKLPRNVYNLMQDINDCLTNTDMNIIKFSYSIKLIELKKKPLDELFSIPYLCIALDIFYKNRLQLASFYDMKRYTSPNVKFYFIMSWLCAYRFLFTYINSKYLQNGSDYDAVFFKIFEDTLVYALEKDGILPFPYNGVKEHITHSFLIACNDVVNTNFKHSDYLTENEISNLLV